VETSLFVSHPYPSLIFACAKTREGTTLAGNGCLKKRRRQDRLLGSCLFQLNLRFAGLEQLDR
jgi:hypothetical protein